MKKLSVILWLLAAPVLAQAQSNEHTWYNNEGFRVIASIFVLGMFMIFILAILRNILNNKIKHKILEKDIPVEVASSILKTGSNEGINSNIKWFAILLAMGIAFMGIHYTLPLGLHSLAIMAFSISGSFLGYYFFLKFSGNKPQ